MLFPRSHAWTPKQRLSIVAGVLLALCSFGALVYTYERYYRGLREAELVGTWTRSDPGGSGLYYEFRRDGSIIPFDEEGPSSIKGKWYAGGGNMYVRFPPETLEDRQLVVWHIVDISPDQFHVRAWKDDAIMTWRRVMPPKASNQTMQPTASPRTAPVSHE